MPRWPRNDYLKYDYARNYVDVDAQMPLELRARGATPSGKTYRRS
jgi:hypothetical protein